MLNILSENNPKGVQKPSQNDQLSINVTCRNRSLGLTTKARACKGVGQEGSLGVWESVKMNTHTPQMNSYFGSWSLGGFSNLQRAIAAVKTHQIRELFISMEIY